MEWIYYLIIIIITIVIAFAIAKSKSKDFKIEVNKLVANLGGKDNIIDYEFNKSRFIVSLVDIEKVNKEAIQKMGAQGIVEIDNQLKIILSDSSKQLKNEIDNLMSR